MLASGKQKAQGIEVVSRSGPLAVFSVEGFPKEIVLHDEFRRFIKDITTKLRLDQALLSKELIDSETARLIKDKLDTVLKQGNNLPKGTGQDLAALVVEKLVSIGWTEKDAVKRLKVLTSHLELL